MNLPPEFARYNEDEIRDLILSIRSNAMIRMAGRALAKRFNADGLFDAMISNDVPADILARCIILFRDANGDKDTFLAKLRDEPGFATLANALQ